MSGLRKALKSALAANRRAEAEVVTKIDISPTGAIDHEANTVAHVFRRQMPGHKPSIQGKGKDTYTVTFGVPVPRDKMDRIIRKVSQAYSVSVYSYVTGP